MTAEQTSADWWAVAELAIAMVDFTPTAASLMAMPDGPDGYGTGCTDRGGPGTIANPTLATIAKLAGGKLADETDDGRPTPDTWMLRSDQVSTTIDLLNAKSTEFIKCAKHIAVLKRMIEKRGDARTLVRSTVTDCLACERTVDGVGNDKIKGGYCPGCKQAWLRFCVAENQANRPADHDVFRKRRRDKLAKMAAETEREAKARRRAS